MAIHEVITTEEYSVDLDEHKNGQGGTLLLVHLRILKWTPGSFKRLLGHWHLFRQCVAAPLFALGEVDDDKYMRFMTRMGFTYLYPVTCENGESRRLFIHRVVLDTATEAHHPCPPAVRPKPRPAAMAP